MLENTYAWLFKLILWGKKKDFEYRNSWSYRKEVCPGDPASVRVIPLKEDYCDSWGCANSADCLRLTVPQCYGYCMHCGVGIQQCDFLVSRGRVAPKSKVTYI